jgi:hypothetical protein
MPKHWGTLLIHDRGKELRKGRVRTIIATHRQRFGEHGIRAKTNGSVRLVRDCLAEYRTG